MTNDADLRDATPEEIGEEPTIVLQAMVDGGFGELSDVTVELARQELARRLSASADASDDDCEGHPSIDGPIGNVVYCDGQCKQ